MPDPSFCGIVQTFQQVGGIVHQLLSAGRGDLIALERGAVSLVEYGSLGGQIGSAALLSPVGRQLDHDGLDKRTSPLDPVHEIDEKFETVACKGEIADADRVDVGDELRFAFL